jgi:hypothetical protein
MLHKTAEEHFEKLKRVAARLDKEVHKDDLDDFFKTAYHLIEVTEKDPASTAAQKISASALRQDMDVAICRDICNGQKHFTLDPKRNPNPIVAGAVTRQGFGVGGYGKGGYGVGEQSVTINLSDGTHRDALDLVRSIEAKWSTVF